MASNTTTFSRRNVLKGATASAALMAAVRTSFPAGAFAQGAGPETNKVTLGFIALTDSSPLIIAKEKKLFDKYGLTDANVAKQASWGTTRDNIVLGSGSGGIDGDAKPLELLGDRDRLTVVVEAAQDIHRHRLVLRRRGAHRDLVGLGRQDMRAVDAA